MPDLDQVFTSAGYAMWYAMQNWPDFEQFLIRNCGRAPIGLETLTDHARHVTALIDPERIATD